VLSVVVVVDNVDWSDELILVVIDHRTCPQETRTNKIKAALANCGQDGCRVNLLLQHCPSPQWSHTMHKYWEQIYRVCQKIDQLVFVRTSSNLHQI